MPATTWIERELMKLLEQNTKAMFGVALGDSHQHARIKGIRDGLEMAVKLCRQDPLASDDKDSF